MAQPAYSYGTQATVHGSKPTDSYYVLDTNNDPSGGTVIVGDLDVTGTVTAAAVTSAFSTVADPNGNAVFMGSSTINFTDAGALRFTARQDASSNTLLVTNSGFQGINIDQATGNVTHTAATTMNGTTTVTRAAAGVDGYLKVLNSGGEGIGIRAYDPASGPNGTVLLQTVINSTTNGATALQFDASGNVQIPLLNTVASVQRPLPAGGAPSATPGTYNVNVLQGGVGIAVSAAFTVNPANIYRWAFDVGPSTVATTGELVIGIYDAAGTSRQIQCFSCPNSILASAAGIAGGYTGLFQPAVASCAFYAFNQNGANADTLCSFTSGLGAVGGFRFWIENLGPA